MIEVIMQIVNNFVGVFNEYARNNQVIAGVVSLWGLSVLSYFSRNIPKQIYTVVIKHTTTTMTLLSSSKAFYEFTDWFYKQGYSDKARRIKITSGKWGDDDALKSIGYGVHHFFYGYVPFKIGMTKVDNTNAMMERDEITLTVLGRSHKFFDNLFEDIRKNSTKKEKLQVYKYNRDYWQKAPDQIKRNMDTVFLKDNVKQIVIEHIDTFVSREDWYISNGLSYQTGIMLYGYPGCGKTSIVKAIASKYNKELYILSAGSLSRIDSAMMDLPDNSLLLIEDIDTDPVTHERKRRPKEPAINDTHDEIELPEFSFTNFSDVLNSLDGIITSHGRILIGTTNHIEKLDQALIRNGRFDLKVEIGYANDFVIKNFFRRYYPEFTISDGFRPRSKIQSSTIQNLILKNLNDPEGVLGELEL